MNNHHPRPHVSDHECLALPRFERVKYFYGQLLGVREFQSEQAYFLEKHRLHNRYLHGYGVVCGLEVTSCDPPRPPPKPTPVRPPATAAHARRPVPEPAPSQDAPRPVERPGSECVCVELGCGLALDCQGNEIVVPAPIRVDLVDYLDCDDRKAFRAGRPAYVSICFVECPVDHVRPITADGCGGLVPDCVPSRLRDDFRIVVSLHEPPHDVSCSPCERPCCEPCLPLARVTWCDGEVHIDSSLRRTIAPFVPTRITGVSWAHGGDYAAGTVDEMLAAGLEIEFSADVRVDTLTRGVIDVWIVQGGGGRRGDIYNAAVHLVPSPGADPAFTRMVTVHVGGGRPDRPGDRDRRDRIDRGDRVIVQLRSAFVLDRCCRAVDGDHVGGLVPVLDGALAKWPPRSEPRRPPCRPPEPRPLMPWASGNGTPAGNFESWFFVDEQDG